MLADFWLEKLRASFHPFSFMFLKVQLSKGGGGETSSITKIVIDYFFSS